MREEPEAIIVVVKKPIGRLRAGDVATARKLRRLYLWEINEKIYCLKLEDFADHFRIFA